MALQNSGAISLDDIHVEAGGTSGTSGTWEANFGGTNTYTISSGNADDNGYGNFEYSPNITGDSTAKKFYACNTKNLAEFG